MIQIDSLKHLNKALPIEYGHVDVYPARKELPGFYEFRVSYTKNSAYVKPIERSIKMLPTKYDEIAKDAIKYFNEEIERTNPSFSCFMGVIFALLLHQYFGADFMEALDNQELFHGIIPFIPYSECKEIYDEILSSNEFKNIDKTKGWCPFVYDLFEITFLRSQGNYKNGYKKEE